MILICILELILIIFLFYRSANIQKRVDKIEAKVHRIVSDLMSVDSSPSIFDDVVEPCEVVEEGESEDGSSTV